MYERLTQLRDKRARGENGFTLIELLVVVVIIGILIAIAIPLYLNYRKGANDKSAQSDLRGAISALEQCQSDTNSYPASLTFTNGVATPCTGQKISLSSGTDITYVANTGQTSYDLYATNSNGNVTAGSAYYCYVAEAGGSVTKVSGAIPSGYKTSC